ncbi:Inner membrane amino-acid ABC transporter permease protein YecS [compost metagenome]
MSNQKIRDPRESSFLRPEELEVVPLRHPWLYVAIGLLLVGLVAIGHAVVTNREFQWPVVGQYLFHPLILQGLWTTILLTIVIMVLAVAIGTVVALMMLSTSKMLSTSATTFVWLFRGAPALVQLILWYNLSLVFKTVTLWLPGIGTVFSVSMNDIMTPFVAAIIALSLHEAGYMAEIVRGGLKAVAKGQTEAAVSLGMKPSQLLRRIVIPQAMRMIIPPTGNETINLLKMTSLVSTIAVGDLLYSAQAIYARTFETIPLLLVVTIWYLIAVSVMSIGQYHLERHFSREEHAAKPSLYKDVFSRIFTFQRKGVSA